ncbi:tetratricopeptide repeat protein 17, partial [Caerostris extrusa]
LDSVYSLKRPYDLVALIQQEKRAVVIEDLKQQLMKQKEEIDRREDKETNLEGKIYATDEDCVAAEKPLTDFDLYASTVVPFPPYKEFGDDFTDMNAFEHLVGVRDRHNLTMTAEMGLQHAVTTVEDIDLYGHLVQNSPKNRTSWILFNMAAYYWRIQGNATNAIECVRRALHYSPREFKDISLINLGNILHLSHLPEEAAIVVHAAVDVAPTNAICHFTLGNIYAVLADYNKYHAVMCHDKLETALESQHINLQNTLTELREYQKQHQYWVKEHEKLLSEQAPPEVKLEQRLEYEEQKIRESLDGRGQDCFQFEQNGHMVLSCNMRRDAYSSAQSQVDLSLNLQLLQAMELRAGKLGQKMAAKQNQQWDMKDDIEKTPHCLNSRISEFNDTVCEGVEVSVQCTRDLLYQAKVLKEFAVRSFPRKGWVFVVLENCVLVSVYG